MQVWTGKEQGDAFVGWLSTQLPSALAQSRLPKLLQVKWPSTNCSTAFPEPPRHLAHHKPASAKTLSMKKGSLTEIWSFSALKVELLACCQLKNAVYSNSKHALSLSSCNLPAQNWWPYWLAYTVPCVYAPSSSVYAPSPTEECMHALLSLTRPPTNLLCRQLNASMGQASYLSHRTLLTNSLMEAFP